MAVKRIAQVALIAALTTLTGCAGGVKNWIADTRVHQGDVAFDRGNLREAELEYRLALRVSPSDARARAGFTQVALQLADAEYRNGSFDDAVGTLNEAAKYDAQNVRIAALRAQIDDAKLKREIVSSNYPTYQTAIKQIQAAYVSLPDDNKQITRHLRRFQFTYNTSELTSAIQQSYQLQQDVAKNTNRLIAYRQLVESGIPAPKGESASAATSAQSLLPLP